MYRTTTLFLGFLILCNSAQASINPGKMDSGSGHAQEEQHHQQQQRCTFRGRQYLPGEVWQANMSSPPCVLCSCLQSGKMNCTRLECCETDDSNGGNSSAELENNRSIRLTSSGGGGAGGGGGGGGGGVGSGVGGTTAGTTRAPCCEACGRASSAVVGGTSTTQTISHYERDSSSHYDDDEETDDDDPLVRANLEHVSCLHQGKIYRDGEVFAANMSGLPISSRGRDHCMHCVCQGGMVLCTMKPCADFQCNKNSSSSVTEACCEKCNADRQSVNMKTTGESGGQKAKGAERSGLGDMNDIADAEYLYTSVSTGEEAEALGSTLDSQEARHFIVNHRLVPPGKRTGCVSAGKFHFHGSTWHPVIGPFGPMECVLCKCLHGKTECNRLPCPSVGDLQCSTVVKLEGSCCPTCVPLNPLGIGERQLCVPASQDVTVYRAHTQAPANETEVIRLSFVRVKGNWNPKFQVEIHEWTLTGGRITRFFTTYCTVEDFLKAQRKRASILLGATSTRNLEKFTKREKKLHFRCKLNCSVRVQSIQLTLRLHELVAKAKCSFLERNVL